MNTRYLRYLLLLPLVALAVSFAYSPSWLQLCYGLALFLFGMQCIEDGLHSVAGGKLSRWMEKSTTTPLKGALFGMGATFVLQSSTLVSLLTIAFLSTGMIALAGGIAIILGTNLGATSGIWLLAAVGKSVSLSPVAVPMLVFGILMSFFNSKIKAVGRVLVGIALIFLGVDAIKEGFQAFGADMDFSKSQVGGWAEPLIFFTVGLLLTVVLQSSHATLILTLAALAGGQVSLMQSFAIAVGSNVGSSATTALVGMLGGDRNGKRLALAHVVFNIVTAVLSLILWWPLTQIVLKPGEWWGLSPLMQLALFHTLFNLLGVTVFWKQQERLAALLLRWIPDKPAEAELTSAGREKPEPVKPRYLNDNVLRATDTALLALAQETRHLAEISVEAVCRALYIPPQTLYEGSDPEGKNLPQPQTPLPLDAPELYEWHVKPLYSAILDFSGKLDLEDEEQQQQLAKSYAAAWRVVEIVKESKHLQKNMQQYLAQPDSAAARDYLRLRRHVFKTLNLFHRIYDMEHGEARREKTNQLSVHTETLETFRGRVMVKLRNNELNGWQTSSLLNDINYARRIGRGVLEILEEA
ncbi:Na/Pi cotransporter family protein [Neisseria animalis]|uniref:Na/Pi cotransporter family protein n=1 Tax=Neisseria animalis TaxID=492 RepID=A0A5P3MTY7_NEIAN|nr:Na/Pi symporter [Neisseria animalis]QEY24960.1 Na/Pi cotransporter family protein [Neisseria animalis]ROW32921.1 Na/Pi cotransporter family protein [Neisseria animalis]VEE09629.1 Na/Pi-cotransporter II-related protein [Neisseria animalis]